MAPYARDNQVDPHVRSFIFLYIGAALAAASLTALAVFARKRASALDIIERATALATPLCLAGLAPFLFDHRLWVDRDGSFLVLTLAWGFGMRAAVRRAGEVDLAALSSAVAPLARAPLARAPLAPRAVAAFAAAARALSHRAHRARRAPLAQWASANIDAPLLSVVAGASAYAAYFSAITISHHRNFGTSAFDLGGWDNLMWNLVHAPAQHLFRSTPFMGPTGSHMARHATFFAYVIAPIYALAPHPETLLVMQAVVLGWAAAPLYLYARRHLPPWTAAIVAWLYLIYAPLHGANLYDFHFLTLSVPFLWLLLLAVESRRSGWVIATTILALSVREDVGCCVGALGLWLLLSGAAARTGAAIAAAGFGYFLVMKLGVMPRFSDSGETFINQYAGLLPQGQHSFGSILETIALNPPFTTHVVLERDKIVYALKLLAPVLLLPLARPITVLLMLPGAVFTLLSTGYAPLYQISFQYTAYWTPLVFVAVVVELERVTRAHLTRDGSCSRGGALRRRCLLAGLVATSLACSYLYGAILPHEGLRCGTERPRFRETPEDVQRRADLAALSPKIPENAKVAASEHLLPHVSGREVAYTLRFGVHDADYILFAVPMRADERDRALPLLRAGSFGVVDDRGGMALARRGESTSLNAALLTRASAP
jgi:uncharacterized membrane protein